MGKSEHDLQLDQKSSVNFIPLFLALNLKVENSYQTLPANKNNSKTSLNLTMSVAMYWTGRFLVKGTLKQKVSVELSTMDNNLAKALSLTNGNIFLYDEKV